jgi:hypothetical protein
MKNKIVYTALALAVTVMFTGCCSCPQHPQGQAYNILGSQWSIVNNSGYLLDVFQDGRKINAGPLGVGQVLPLRMVLFQPDSVVTVVGHTEGGQYVGSGTHRFSSTENDTWSVIQLYAPMPVR